MLRASGLNIKTPQTILDAVLGCNLETFVRDQIILTGLKILGDNFHEKLDRTALIVHPL